MFYFVLRDLCKITFFLYLHLSNQNIFMLIFHTIRKLLLFFCYRNVTRSFYNYKKEKMWKVAFTEWNWGFSRCCLFFRVVGNFAHTLTFTAPIALTLTYVILMMIMRLVWIVLLHKNLLKAAQVPWRYSYTAKSSIFQRRIFWKYVF